MRPTSTASSRPSIRSRSSRNTPKKRSSHARLIHAPEPRGQLVEGGEKSPAQVFEVFDQLGVAKSVARDAFDRGLHDREAKPQGSLGLVRIRGERPLPCGAAPNPPLGDSDPG